MKNKKTLLIIILAFVLLLAGASVLYNFLGKYMDTNQLTTQEESSPAASQEEDTPETSESETNSEAAESESNSDTSEEQETTTANPAPDFTVTDIEGNEVNFADFVGKPIILNFWASWCGPCKSEMPDFDDAYAEYKDNIHFLMVNLTDGSRETVESASSYISQQGYSFPVYYDTMTDAALTYGVYSVPVTYFIDADGNLIAHAQGAMDRETLQTGIDMIYSE